MKKIRIFLIVFLLLLIFFVPWVFANAEYQAPLAEGIIFQGTVKENHSYNFQTWLQEGDPADYDVCGLDWTCQNSGMQTHNAGDPFDYGWGIIFMPSSSARYFRMRNDEQNYSIMDWHSYMSATQGPFRENYTHIIDLSYGYLSAGGRATLEFLWNSTELNDDSVVITIKGVGISEEVSHTIEHSAHERYFIRFNIDTIEQKACFKMWTIGSAESDICLLETDITLGNGSLDSMTIRDNGSQTSGNITFDQITLSQTPPATLITGPEPAGYPDSGVYYTDQFNTRFVDYSLTASTTIAIDYIIDPGEVTPDPRRSPTHIRLDFAENNTGETYLPVLKDISIPEDDSVQSTTTQMIVLGGDPPPDGYYTVQITFENWPDVRAFEGTAIWFDVDIVGGEWQNVVRSNIQDARVAETVSGCSLTRLDRCLILAFQALWQPSQQSLSQFSSLGENITSRFPFRYISDIQDIFAVPEGTVTTYEIVAPMSIAGIEQDLVLFNTQDHIVDNEIWPESFNFTFVRQLMGWFVYIVLLTIFIKRIRSQQVQS